MRAVERQIREERPVALRLNEVNRCAREDVAAIALVPLRRPVVLQNRVEVAAPPRRVRILADAAPFVHQGLLKSLVNRPHRCVVSQVPLAEDPCPIAGRSKHLSERDFVRIQERPAQVRVDHARPVVVSPGEQAGARRCADRRNIKVLEPYTLPGKLVEVRRLDLRVAMSPQVAKPLVVAHDDEHIRLPLRRRGRGPYEHCNQHCARDRNAPPHASHRESSSK